MSEETPEEPKYHRLGPINWLPEERKVVERFEERVRDLERRLAIAEARADYAQWKLESTKVQRPYRVAEVLTTAKGAGVVALPGKLRSAMQTRKGPKPPRPVAEVIEELDHRGPSVDVPQVKWPRDRSRVPT
ncbi:hypothetical protein ACFQX6_39920 [Streptosporangium lutulentum]